MSSAAAIGARPSAFAQRCDVRFPGAEPADVERPARGSAREERGLEDLPSGGWTGLGRPSVLPLDDCGQADLGWQRAPSTVIGQASAPLATVRLRRPARISSWTVPNSPSRRPPQPSHAIAVHSFFAKFSHFPGFSVERQSKRRTHRRASWDSDAFERVPFLSVSRLSQTQGGCWRGRWRLFSNRASVRRGRAGALRQTSSAPGNRKTEAVPAGLESRRRTAPPVTEEISPSRAPICPTARVPLLRQACDCPILIG